jgi:hypothetical protein
LAWQAVYTRFENLATDHSTDIPLGD